MNKKKKSEEIEESVEQAKQVEKTEENKQSESQSEESEDIDFQDKYMRLYAEFDNFRKRTMREKAELIGSASSDIMFQLLPLVDDFDRAQENETDDVAALKEGMELIHSKLVATLISKGLKPMEAKTGDDFDGRRWLWIGFFMSFTSQCNRRRRPWLTYLLLMRRISREQDVVSTLPVLLCL